MVRRIPYWNEGSSTDTLPFGFQATWNIVHIEGIAAMTDLSALAQQPANLTLWYTRCPVPSAAGIAIRKGWLDEEFNGQGISVRSLRASTDRSVRESHFAHTQQNSFRQGGNGPALWTRSQGQDTVLLGLSWVEQYQGILTLPGSGIESLTQLKGKRLALPQRLNDQIDFWRSISLQGYANALSLVGLSLKDVNLVSIPITDTFISPNEKVDESGPLFTPHTLVRQHTAELLALLRGEVDVIFGYSVWGAEIKAQFRAIEVADLSRQAQRHLRINNGQPKTLTVSGNLLRSQPELVVRYVAQLLRAAEWSARHRGEARRIIAQEVGSAEFWLDETARGPLEDNLRIGLDDDLVAELEIRKRFLLEHGFIKSDFSLQEWIDPGPLLAAHRLIAAQTI